jgi:hypothetical protein
MLSQTEEKEQREMMAVLQMVAMMKEVTMRITDAVKETARIEAFISLDGPVDLADLLGTLGSPLTEGMTEEETTAAAAATGVEEMVALIEGSHTLLPELPMGL